MPWLIREDVAHEMQRRISTARPPAGAETKFTEAVEAARNDKGPRSLSVAGNVAEIRVEGVLTKAPDFWLWFLGYANTSYLDVQAALAQADTDPAIERIELFFDSPGGNVDGLFDVLAALEATKKPLTARVEQACSAAYAMAAQASRIEATNAASVVGSIGVVASYRLQSDVVTITSTEAPNKRPDLSTKEGQAVVRKHLDDIHELFADAIARGRGTTVERVNAEFGRGAVFLAAEAKSLGMIDSVRGQSPTLALVTPPRAEPSSNSSADGGGATSTSTRKKMDEKELKAQHPELFKAVFDKGGEAALKEERDRVNAHLTMGEKSGAMDIALKAVRSGEGLTQTLIAEYMTATRNKTEREGYAAATQAADQVAQGAQPNLPSTSKSPADALGALLDDDGNLREVSHG